MTLTTAERDTLISAALAARDKAYAPYSKFHVGAALLLDDGSIVAGCNVENISYGLTICAERVAIGTMVAQGKSSPRAVAVATEGGGSPCGACRQVLAEFAPALPVYLIDATTRDVVETNMTELLPRQFATDLLGK
ncbi:MAG: cytidine deaminase [Pirellulales bacterium]